LTGWVQHYYANTGEAADLFKNIIQIMVNSQYTTFKAFLHGSLIGTLLAALCEKGEKFPGWKVVMENFNRMPSDVQAAFYAAAKMNQQLFEGIPESTRVDFNTVLNLDTLSLPLHIK
jgi:hypothetical protein